MSAEPTDHSQDDLPDHPDTDNDPVAQEPSENDSFPIVGIGASAGGLEAFNELLSHLPKKSGMAFVLIQHLDPKHESQLVELLSRATTLPVGEAAEGVRVQPDHVYVIPRGTNMAIESGVLKLSPRGVARVPHLPLDFFLRSLAESHKRQVSGVVLSGTGSDGTAGLAEIKGSGGLTFAQDQDSAAHGGMPLSAVKSGCVDFVMTPAEIAHELGRIGSHSYFARPSRTASPELTDGDGVTTLGKILALLRSTFGVDFGQYRETTVQRRIMRRMVLHHHDALSDYARQLQTNRQELEALYHDVLISVTGFFRDPQMFDALKKHVFPEILKSKSPQAPIRIWTAGCSTGQEAYSLAIAFTEFLDEMPQRSEIQIFATDLSDSVALVKARDGHYPESIESEVSAERLRRFFRREDGGYRIVKAIRDLCVFAKQNLASDPPFSRLDLISCRNVLIYLAPPLQKQIISTFHYALNPGGFLVLGSSETIGKSSELFELADRENKFYQRRTTTQRVYPHFSVQHSLGRKFAGEQDAAERQPIPADWQKEADRIVVERYAPVGVLVNDRLEVLQFRGRTSDYLEPPAGEASFSLFKMAREGLFGELRGAISEAREKNETVHRHQVRVRGNGQLRIVDLKVIPLHFPNSTETCFLVLFEVPENQREGPPETRGVPGRPAAQRPRGRWWRGLLSALPTDRRDHAATSDDGELEQLHRELVAAREHQQSLLEQQEAANEELRATNEETLSSNEELQSTNEELETAKEELQSLNEELTTVNDQLQNRNSELSRLNDDLSNFLASAQVPIVMLGSDLRIRRLTPQAEKTLRLRPADIGRALNEVRLGIDLPELEQFVLDVIDSAEIRSREVRDHEGRWHSLRIHPFRTTDNRIEGASLSFLDIDEVKRSELEHREAIVATMREALLVLDGELRIQSANRAYYDTFQVSPQETEQQLLYELGNGQWDIPMLRMHLEEILPRNNAFEGFEVEQVFPGIGQKTMRLNARRLYQPGENKQLILLAIEDITEFRRAEKRSAEMFAREQALRQEAEAASRQFQKLNEELRQSEQALKDADRYKDEFLAMLAHELRNPLAALCNAVQVMNISQDDPQRLEWTRNVMAEQVELLARLIDDLLDVARITRGKITLREEPLDVSALVKRAVESVKPLTQARGHELELSGTDEAIWLRGDSPRLGQVLTNLLTNSAKYTEPGGRIRITAKRDADWVVIKVSDTGIGISEELLPHVFEIFFQDERSADRASGGLGIGLTLVKSLVELHGGSVEAKSDGLGKGSEFIVRLPATDEDLAGKTPDADPAPTGIHAGPPRRILVVDDNRAAVMLLSRLLATGGHEIESEFDGLAALERAVEFEPHAILLDIGMPGLDGHEVARRIRQIPKLKDALLIAISGYCQEDDMQRSRQAGFDHHLVKPVDYRELLDLIAKIPAEKNSLSPSPGENEQSGNEQP